MKDARKYLAVLVMVILTVSAIGAGLFVTAVEHSWAQSDDTIVNVSIPAGASTLSDAAYKPNPVEVSVGETVIWTNDDAQPHTATSGNPTDGPDGKFGGTMEAPVILVKAQTQEFTFAEAGEYDYYCTLHPNMVGTVVVASDTASTVEPAQSASGDIPQEPSFSVPGLNSSSAVTMDLEEAKQLYLSAWNNTQFNATFSTFVEEGSALGYGIYEEHAAENVFEPGEAMVLYAEVVGFTREPLVSEDDEMLYQMAFTADYVISDDRGRELQNIQDVPVGSIISHRENTELFIELTLTQESSFPEGDYVLTYIVNDTASGETFELTKNVSVADPVSSAQGSSSLEEETTEFSDMTEEAQNLFNEDDSNSANVEDENRDNSGGSSSTDDDDDTPSGTSREEEEEDEENDCDPSYPDVCIPSAPPDLDCGDVSHDNFRVRSPDPHRFDNDDDGRGCEG